MTRDYSLNPKEALFTQNTQVKDQLVSIIIDKGNQINLAPQKLISYLQLPTTTHPTPSHLGWVIDVRTKTLITRQSAVTFANGPFEIYFIVMSLHSIVLS
jgi:hypothetical protein